MTTRKANANAGILRFAQKDTNVLGGLGAVEFVDGG